MNTESKATKTGNPTVYDEGSSSADGTVRGSSVDQSTVNDTTRDPEEILQTQDNFENNMRTNLTVVNHERNGEATDTQCPLMKSKRGTQEDNLKICEVPSPRDDDTKGGEGRFAMPK